MSIKDVTAVIDAKAIKRYCDSKSNGGICSNDCVFEGHLGCILPSLLGMNGKDKYINAMSQIDEKLNELSK